MKKLRLLLTLLLVFVMSGCKVYQVDYNTLPAEDQERLRNQRHNSHVRIQSGWINNPFYWNNGYYGNWNGWGNFGRFTSPAIIIKRQPNKRRHGNNTRNVNPVRGSRGAGNSVNRQPARQKVKPQLPTRLRRGSTGGNKNEH